MAERERIARRLRTDSVHSLFTISMELVSIASSCPDQATKHRLHGCVEQMDAAIVELRRHAMETQANHQVRTGPREQHLVDELAVTTRTLRRQFTEMLTMARELKAVAGLPDPGVTQPDGSHPAPTGRGTVRQASARRPAAGAETRDVGS